MIRKAATATLFLAGFATLCLAQQQPNFTGTWKLNTAKSDFGALPPTESQLSVIEHADPSLKVTNTVQGGVGGSQQYTLIYTTDGKEAVNKLGPRDVKSTGAWQDGKLTMKSKFNYNDSEVTQTSTWALSADGAILTQSVHYESAMGETDQTLIFEKGSAQMAAKTLPTAPTPTTPMASTGPRPNFSGTWKLVPAKSDFGMMPPPAARVDIIEHSEPLLKLTRQEKGAEGDRNYVLNLSNDGKESANDVGGGFLLKVTNTWEGSALVSLIKLKFQDQDVNIKQVSTLSADGKVLTNKNHISMAMGEMDQTEVYEKQVQ